MSDHLGSDLDELLLQRSERPFLHRLGQYQTPHKITKVVSQSEELKADLISHKIMAGQSCLIRRVFSLFDPLSSCASLIVELDNIARFPPKVRDHEVDPWKKLSHMPLDLDDDSASDLPTGRLTPKSSRPVLRGA